MRDHHAGAIDGDQFVELSHIVSFDAAVAGLVVAAGQTVVPLPVLGALLGSLAGRIVSSALKDGLGESASDLAARLAEYERDALVQLDEEYRVLVQRLDNWFANLEQLASTAFDPEQNTRLRLEASVQAAESVGVPATGILRTTRESRRVPAGVNMDPLRESARRPLAGTVRCDVVGNRPRGWTSSRRARTPRPARHRLRRGPGQPPHGTPEPVDAAVGHAGAGLPRCGYAGAGRRDER